MKKLLLFCLLCHIMPAQATVETRIQQYVNQYRHRHGLNSLKISPIITQVAKEHSYKMATGFEPFGQHKNFRNRKHRIAEYLRYGGIGENEMYIPPTEDDLAMITVKGWINSPAHNKILLGQYNTTGIGVAKSRDGQYFITQIYWLK